MYLFKSLFYFNPGKYGDSVEERLQRFEEINRVSDPEKKSLRTEDSLGDGTDYVCFSTQLAGLGFEATSHILMTFEENPRVFTSVTQDEESPRHAVNLSLMLPALEKLRKEESLSAELGLEETGMILNPDLRPEEIADLLLVKERASPLALISETFEIENAELENQAQTTLITRRLTQDQLVRFNDYVGPSHSIPRKGLRIFSYAPRYSVSGDGVRHPVIFGEELTDLESLVWRKTRKAAFSDTKVFEAEVSVLSAKLLLSRANMSITISETDSEDLTALKNTVLELKETVSSLSRKVAQLEQAYQDQELELLNSMDFYSTLHRRYQYLEKKFREHGFFEYQPDQGLNEFWEDVPNSFAEIVEKIPETNHLVFTGSLDGIKWCDEQADIMTPLIKCMDVMKAMEAYATLKLESGSDKFSGSFFDYLKDTKGSTFKVSPQVISMKESEQVRNNPKLRDERLFKVPAEVSIQEQEFMEAHAKLRVVGGSAIRMHFYDDTANTGKIYIGYIGKHLPLPN